MKLNQQQIICERFLLSKDEQGHHSFVAIGTVYEII